MQNNPPRKNIAIVAGGFTSEWEISLKSAEGIKTFLKGTPYNLYEVIIRDANWYCFKDGKQFPVDKNDFSILTPEGKVKFDYAYITIHGNPGENGNLQGYFEMIGVPYSTSSPLVSAITYDKYACKEFLKSKEVLLAKSILVKGNDFNVEEILRVVGLPCVVKPNVGGSSFGVSKVKRKEDFMEAIRRAQEESDEILVEEFIEGTELSSGFCRIGEEVKVFPIAEIVSEGEFFDYEAKYKGKSQEIVPARLSEQLTQKVQETTKKVALWLNLRYLSRVDYILRGEDLYLLEINTTPGMTTESIIPKEVRASGGNMQDYLVRIIEDA